VTPNTPCSIRSSPLETFVGTVAEAGDGVGLPQFVEREFREFLTCGVFEAGVGRPARRVTHGRVNVRIADQG
jgi:hypothetical protein